MTYLACDLGAESGRLMAGSLKQGRIAIEEVHRFANSPVRTGASIHWDVSGLLEGLKAGLRKAASCVEAPVSISTDSWGLDYILFSDDGTIIPPTFHYRDPRSGEGMKRAANLMDRVTIFEETGIQFMPMNTIYQLATETPGRLENAHQLLMIADAFNYLLSGVAVSEESLASTSQLYNPRTRQWSGRLMSALRLPERIFTRIVPSGTRLGNLREDIRRETGLPELEVIASCSHDTGAAVAAVPAITEDGWGYISSGTWSLMGVEVSAPVITETCQQLNFTNEVGFGGTMRLLKNIVGLWLVQECRREWAKSGQHYEYATLTQMAENAPPFRSLIQPAHEGFIAPDDMPAKICAYCAQTEQPAPRNPGEMVRCALESLALLYRHTLLEIEKLTGRRISVVHIVGGGSQNDLLNQFTSNALQVPVFAGPAEATSIGNILVQAIARGELQSLHEGRRTVAASTHLQRVEPQERQKWESAYERFERLRG